MLLTRQDERTVRALRNLRGGSSDFNEFLAWLEHSLAELDSRNRTTIPEALLRQQQGAAQVIAELVDAVQGKQQSQAIERVRQRPTGGLA